MKSGLGSPQRGMARLLLTMKFAGNIHQNTDISELVALLSNQILESARNRIKEKGIFHLALSGGSTPKLLFKHMISAPFKNCFPWESTHVWQVDERLVPPVDDRSNWKMITMNLIDKVPVPRNQTHPMPVLEPNGDQQYEASLREYGAVPLDFVLLGIGSDGHTASLFPFTPALREKKRLVVFSDGITVAEPRPRLTLTFTALNSANRVAVLVAGSEKIEILAEISLNRELKDRYPILGLRNPNQEWFVQMGS